MDRQEVLNEVIDQIKDEDLKKRAYQPPYLEKLGDLRSLTLGPSPGMFYESGSDNVYSEYTTSP